MRYLIFTIFMAILFSSFRYPVKMQPMIKDVENMAALAETITANLSDASATHLEIDNNTFIEYAKKFIGVKYVWGSVNPKIGLDCSGFVNHVSNHFGITVPRNSAQFTNLGMEVKAEEAKAGDIILFTGSNPEKRIVGHMGIVTENSDSSLNFIHSSSGNKRGVHISELKGYYKTRLVKIVRIFPFRDDKAVA